MAQANWLQAVTAEELRALRVNPTAINELDKSLCYRTHFGTALNYFLTGASWPGPDDHVLWPAINGADSISCATLENAAFSVVSPDLAAQVAAHLATVDPATIETAVGRADFVELVDDHEIYELELITPDEGPELIVAEFARLTAFYTEAARTEFGVVMYCT